MFFRIVARQLKLTVIGFLGGVFLLPVSGIAQQGNSPARLSDIQQIVVVVNDSPISLYDMKQRVLLFMISSCCL